MGIERRFRGEGAFFLANGRRLETVAFRIEQEGSGATFLYCAPTIQISIHIAMRDPWLVSKELQMSAIKFERTAILIGFFARRIQFV
jgi:hypothetical protein